MHALITGGAGFIGSALTQRLLAEGHVVTVLDVKPEEDGQPHRLYFQGDVRDVRLVDDLVPGCDVVFHLASKVGVRHYLGTHRDTLTTILEGTQHVVDACVRHGVRLVNASTSEVYGKGVDLPFTETDDLCYGPTSAARWVYGMSKALAEQIILDAVRHQGLDGRIFRPFNIVGSGQSAEGGLVFPAFAAQAAAGGPLLLHGDGAQTRTFVGVGDVLDGILRLATIPDAAGVVVNLGSDVEYRIVDVAACFAAQAAERLGRAIELRLVPHEEVYGPGFEDTRHRVPDLDYAVSLLGWEPWRLRSLPELVSESLEAAFSRQEVAV